MMGRCATSLGESPAAKRAVLIGSLQENFIVDVDTLQSHGIGQADVQKLKANSIHTIAVMSSRFFSLCTLLTSL